jgi:hypothetical protein
MKYHDGIEPVMPEPAPKKPAPTTTAPKKQTAKKGNPFQWRQTPPNDSGE